MDNVKYNRCDMCNNIGNIKEKYYYYNINCDCCDGNHFEIVRYCEKCEPKPSPKISVYIQPDTEFKTNDCKNHVPDWHGVCFKCGKQVFKTTG